MQYVVQETTPGAFVEVQFGESISIGEVLHPWQITELWADAELEAIGVFRVDPAVPPNENAVVIDYSFSRVEGKVVQLLNLEFRDPPPLKVSPRQLRLAMNELGLRDEIEEYVASQSRDVKDSWQYSTEFYATHPFVQGAKEQLNKSDEELAFLFATASMIPT
jgi:hypothetical protein